MLTHRQRAFNRHRVSNHLDKEEDFRPALEADESGMDREMFERNYHLLLSASVLSMKTTATERRHFCMSLMELTEEQEAKRQILEHAMQSADKTVDANRNSSNAQQVKVSIQAQRLMCA